MQLDVHFGLGSGFNNASSFDITMRLINKCYVKCKYNKCKFCYCVPYTKLFGRLYFAASKMFHQFFFEFAWNWSSVFTGYNDE